MDARGAALARPIVHGELVVRVGHQPGSWGAGRRSRLPSRRHRPAPRMRAQLWACGRPAPPTPRPRPGPRRRQRSARSLECTTTCHISANRAQNLSLKTKTKNSPTLGKAPTRRQSTSCAPGAVLDSRHWMLTSDASPLPVPTQWTYIDRSSVALGAPAWAAQPPNAPKSSIGAGALGITRTHLFRISPSA